MVINCDRKATAQNPTAASAFSLIEQVHDAKLQFHHNHLAIEGTNYAFPAAIHYMGINHRVFYILMPQ